MKLWDLNLNMILLPNFFLVFILKIFNDVIFNAVFIFVQNEIENFQIFFCNAIGLTKIPTENVFPLFMIDTTKPIFEFSFHHQTRGLETMASILFDRQLQRNSRRNMQGNQEKKSNIKMQFAIGF